MLKIASWNVNSLNVRLPQVLAWSQVAHPDVLALQETKLTDDRFPESELRDAGYNSVFSGQKTYNGVAILSRQGASDAVTDIPGLDDPQRRILAATIGGVRIVNLYVVNGSEVGSEKFSYKMHWLERVTDWLAGELGSWWCSVISISLRTIVTCTIRKPGGRKFSAARRNGRLYNGCWTSASTTRSACSIRRRAFSAGGTTG
jgi:exodeoxyribonuclease III